MTTTTEPTITISAIARVYYRLVKAGSRKIESVPSSVRPQVQWLLDEDERLAAEQAAADAAAQAEALNPTLPVTEEPPPLPAPE